MSGVLVGDFRSPEGRMALAVAVDEAILRRAELVVVRQVRTPRTDSEAQSFVDDHTAAKDEVGKTVNQLATDRPQLAIRGRVISGAENASRGLLEAVTAERPQLLVIGMRRRSAVGKLVLGSMVQDVLLRAECPVLAVKSEES